MTDHKQPNMDKKREMANPGGKASHGHSETPEKAANAGMKGSATSSKPDSQQARKPDNKNGGKSDGYAGKSR